MRLRTRNAINLLGLDAADWGQTPTEWQRTQYPQRYWRPDQHRSMRGSTRLSSALRRTARVWLEGGLSSRPATRSSPIVRAILSPIVAFMSLCGRCPECLAAAPRGARPDRRRQWGQLRPRARPAPRPGEKSFSASLTDSSICGASIFSDGCLISNISRSCRYRRSHVYLTYPFVFHGHCSKRCRRDAVVIGSRTPPVEEVINRRREWPAGRLLRHRGLGRQNQLGPAPSAPERRLRQAARATVLRRYDLRRICLPGHLSLPQACANTRLARRDGADPQSSPSTLSGTLRDERVDDGSSCKVPCFPRSSPTRYHRARSIMAS